MITKLTIIISCVLALTPAATTPKQTFQHPEISQVNLSKVLWRESAKTRLQTSVTKASKRVYKTSYVFSGSTTHGWDCSGLVRWVYRQAGLLLPHSADKQAHIGFRVSVPERGDIVVFAYKGSTEFYHSGIYLGAGLVLNANSMYRTTVIEPLSNYESSQIRFVRVL